MSSPLPQPGLSLFDLGPPPPCPARFNMAQHTLAGADVPGARTALQMIGPTGAAGETISREALSARVLTRAAGLAAMGVGPGARVLLRLGNSPDFPISFFAANAVGAVPVATPPGLTAPELAHVLAESAPAAILADGTVSLPAAGPLPLLTPASLESAAGGAQARFADTAAEDPAYVLFTSGTGGQALAVVHAQRAAWARRMMWDGWYGLRPDDRVLHAGGLNWSFTLGAGLTDPWAIGATALIHAGPVNHALWPQIIRDHDISIFAATPGVYRNILKHHSRLDLPSLRHAICAGEALPEALRAQWQEASGRDLLPALGMSEISTYVSRAPGIAHKPGSAGQPQRGRRVAVLHPDTGQPLPLGETGLLAVSRRDPGLMLHYLGRPEQTAAALRGNWFVTGDLARMDNDGHVWWDGRADDMMNAGGYRVAPQEIERVIAACPGIEDVAAVALPVRDGVSVIAVFYTGAVQDQGDLAARCAAALAAYKCPRLFRHLGQMPRGPNTKISRRALIEQHGWKPA